MIADLLKRLGATAPGGAALATPDLDRVAALLLIEIARSDRGVADEEIAVVRDGIVANGNLSPREASELVDEVIAEADATLSLHAHLKAINEALDKSAKIDLVERMWRVAYADGDLDRYEEHRIRSLADLLYLKHREFMQAKHRVTGD